MQADNNQTGQPGQPNQNYNSSPVPNSSYTPTPAAQQPVPQPAAAAYATPEMQGGPGGAPVQPAYMQQQVVAGYTAPNYVRVAKPKQPFTATRTDFWMAIASFVLGYLFVQWMLFSPPWEGWGVTVFVVLYAACMLGYAVFSKIEIPKISWYWLGVLLLTGLAYALWPGGSIGVIRALLLFGAAVYWVGTLFGGLLTGKSGNFFILDALNLVFVVPLRNFGCFFKSFAILSSRQDEDAKAKRSKAARKAGGVLLGVLFCLVLLAVLMPMLLAADGGNFLWLTQNVGKGLSNFFGELFETTWLNPFFLIATVPVALYLCGLAAGLCHKRYHKNFDTKNVQKTLSDFRILPQSTVITVLAGVSVLYVVFICSQLPHYFSAFFGQRAPGYVQYSQLARDGFFELCRITVINLGLLLVLNSMCRTPRMQSVYLRVGNIVLIVLTLLLCTTAFSKMALYIAAHGLTPKRVLTCVAMVFIAGVCCAAVALQFKAFSIMRFALVLGSVLVTALCLVNMDGLIIRYNAQRYMNGTLDAFETVLLAPADGNGAQAALDVYEYTDDEELKNEIARILYELQQSAGYADGHKQSVTSYMLQHLALPEWDME